MTNTVRTTVTLTQYYMNKIEKLVGSFSTTRAQVMSKIIENFIDSKKYINIINQIKMEKEVEKKERAKKEAKRPEIIEQRIKKILAGADEIPLDSFLKYLNIEEDFFYEKVAKWSLKYKFKVLNNKIFRIK
ncbi:MAG: hypothetical protein ACTSQJ_08285 [Promethearchaeota archaeon]